MGVQFRISPTTIFNMKIILALFGFFLTASSLPAPFPPCFPFCNSGQTAPTKNNAIQNCKNGQCNQNNQFSDVPGTATSNCVGSQCNQDNRNKREVMAGGDQERKTFVCAGGVVSSTCDRSVCEVTCSDNSKYQHDCGSLGSQMSSSPGTGGSTVVTVTCGGEPISYPSCFPFCSGSDSPSSQSPGNSVQQGEVQTCTGTQCTQNNDFNQQSPQDVDGNTVDSATTLKSCIDACPVTPTYRGCVTSCLNNRN